MNVDAYLHSYYLIQCIEMFEQISSLAEQHFV
jgi:hypothetical protein